MKCHYKGKPIMGRNGKSRSPRCKKYGSKCVDETKCEYHQRQKQIIKKQFKKIK